MEDKIADEIEELFKDITPLKDIDKQEFYDLVISSFRNHQEQGRSPS